MLQHKIFVCFCDFDEKRGERFLVRESFESERDEEKHIFQMRKERAGKWDQSQRKSSENLIKQNLSSVLSLKRCKLEKSCTKCDATTLQSFVTEERNYVENLEIPND